MNSISETKQASKHTPGPWYHSCDEGNYVCNVNVPQGMLADLEDCDSDNKCADARLMAAAPTLLEACEQARAALPDITFAESPGQRAVIELLNKAIADAQGGVAPEEPNPFADIDRSPTNQGGGA